MICKFRQCEKRLILDPMLDIAYQQFQSVFFGIRMFFWDKKESDRVTSQLKLASDYSNHYLYHLQFLFIEYMYKKQYALLNNCSTSHTKEHSTPFTCASQLNQNCLMPRNAFQRQGDQNTVLSVKSISRGSNSFVSFQELSLNNNKWIIFDTSSPLESDRYKFQTSKKKLHHPYSNRGFSRIGPTFLKRFNKENNKNLQQFKEKGISLFQGKEINHLMTASRTNMTKIKAKTIRQQIKFTKAIKKDETSRGSEAVGRVQHAKTARAQSNPANLSKNVELQRVKTKTPSKHEGLLLATSQTAKNDKTKWLATLNNEPAGNQPQAQLLTYSVNRQDNGQQTEQNNIVSFDAASYEVLAQFYDKTSLLQPNLIDRPYTDNPYQQYDLWQTHKHNDQSPQLTQSSVEHKVHNIRGIDPKIQRQKIAQIKKRSFTTKETENMINSIVGNPPQQLIAVPATSSLQNLPQTNPSPSIQVSQTKYTELNMLEFFQEQQNIHFINIEPSQQASLLPRQLSPPIYIKKKVIKTKAFCYHNEELINWLNLLLKVKPELIHQIFLPFQHNQYSCNLYEEGESRIVNVDGQLPFSANLFPLYGTIEQYIWFGVLLKALAKLKNSYKALNNLNFRYLCKTIINKDVIPYYLDKQDREAIKQLRKLLALCKKGPLFVVAAKQNIFYKVDSISYSKSLSQKKQELQKIIISESLAHTQRDERQNYKTLDDFLKLKKKELTHKRVIKNTRIHLVGVDSNIMLAINQLRTDYQLFYPQSIEKQPPVTD